MKLRPLCLFLLQVTAENMNQKQNQTRWVPKLVVSLCGSPPSLSPCESALSDQVNLYLRQFTYHTCEEGWCFLTCVAGKEILLLLPGWLPGGKRCIPGVRGEAVLDHFADENQDENLWKKRNNGILKWIVRSRRQEWESFTWMAEGPCSSQSQGSRTRWVPRHGPRAGRAARQSSSVRCQRCFVSPGGTRQALGSQAALKKKSF